MRVGKYGFRAGKSTSYAIEKLKNITAESKNTYVAVILVDIKGAFDTLWWPAIMTSINKGGVPRTIYGVIKSYLTERSVQITKLMVRQHIPEISSVVQGPMVSGKNVQHYLLLV